MKLSSLLAASVLAGLSNAKVIFPKEFQDFKCGTYFLYSIYFLQKQASQLTKHQTP